MTFHLDAVLASKRAYRSRLAARPIAEKLRLLDVVRERAVVLRRADAAARGGGQPYADLRAPAPSGDDEPSS